MLNQSHSHDTKVCTRVIKRKCSSDATGVQSSTNNKLGNAVNGSQSRSVCASHPNADAINNQPINYSIPSDDMTNQSNMDHHQQQQQHPRLRLQPPGRQPSYGFPADAIEQSKPNRTHHHHHRMYQYHAPTCKALGAARLLEDRTEQCQHQSDHHPHESNQTQVSAPDLNDRHTDGIEACPSSPQPPPPPSKHLHRRPVIVNGSHQHAITARDEVQMAADKPCLPNDDDSLTADNGNQYYCYKHQRQRQLQTGGNGKQLIPLMRDNNDNQHNHNHSNHINQTRHPSRVVRVAGSNEPTVDPSSSASASAPPSSSSSTQFISQLYFLIHLSALLSLLLHHKNLLSSERRLNGSAATGEAATMATRSYVDFSQSNFTASATELLSSKVEPLPPPMPLAQAGSGRYSEPAQHNGLTVIDPDILVRLLGRSHARHALKYFLTYMLSVSLAILICLWIAGVCSSRRSSGRRRRLISANSHNNTNKQRTALSTNLNYDIDSLVRTGGAPADCTPVLIGSVSLGLIQLIVIGLEIVDSIDWLAAGSALVAANDNNNPSSSAAGNSSSSGGIGSGQASYLRQIYLPLLQFGFVSLLMQFILARVAENRTNSKSGTDGASDGKLASAVSRRRDLRRDSSCSDKQSSTTGSFVGALRNIALAHLLATHILLWLMELNSISLSETTLSTTGSSLAAASSGSSLSPVHLSTLNSNQLHQSVADSNSSNNNNRPFRHWPLESGSSTPATNPPPTTTTTASTTIAPASAATTKGSTIFVGLTGGMNSGGKQQSATANGLAPTTTGTAATRQRQVNSHSIGDRSVTFAASDLANGAGSGGGGGVGVGDNNRKRQESYLAAPVRALSRQPVAKWPISLTLSSTAPPVQVDTVPRAITSDPLHNSTATDQVRVGQFSVSGNNESTAFKADSGISGSNRDQQQRSRLAQVTKLITPLTAIYSQQNIVPQIAADYSTTAQSLDPVLTSTSPVDSAAPRKFVRVAGLSMSGPGAGNVDGRVHLHWGSSGSSERANQANRSTTFRQQPMQAAAVPVSASAPATPRPTDDAGAPKTPARVQPAYRSSLPKRMTAFIQRNRSFGTVLRDTPASSTLAPPVAALIKATAVTSTTTAPSPSSSSSSNSSPKTRYRARVTVQQSSSEAPAESSSPQGDGPEDAQVSGATGEPPVDLQSVMPASRSPSGGDKLATKRPDLSRPIAVTRAAIARQRVSLPAPLEEPSGDNSSVEPPEAGSMLKASVVSGDGSSIGAAGSPGWRKRQLPPKVHSYESTRLRADQGSKRDNKTTRRLTDQVWENDPVLLMQQLAGDADDEDDTAPRREPIAGTSASTSTESSSSASPTDDGDDDDTDVDVALDALLPPVPNYNDTDTDDGSEDDAVVGEAPGANTKADDKAGANKSNRRGRKLDIQPDKSIRLSSIRDGNSTASFAFMEASSSSANNGTYHLAKGDKSIAISQSKRNRPTNQITSANKTIVIEPLPLVMDVVDRRRRNERSLFHSSNQDGSKSGTNHHHLQQQQQQQHHYWQPSFLDLLQPIVQQYQILVLAILFSAWLASLSSPSSASGSISKPANTGNNRHLLDDWTQTNNAPPSSLNVSQRSVVVDELLLSSACSSPSSSSSLSPPVNGGGHSRLQPGETGSSVESLSRASSTKRLMEAAAVTSAARHKHNKRRHSHLSRSRSAADAAAAAAAASAELAAELNRQNSRSSSSVCTIFLGLLVVSGALIVIVLDINLLSLLAQCLTQVLAILATLVGLCLLSRVRRYQGQASELSENPPSFEHHDDERGYLPTKRLLLLAVSPARCKTEPAPAGEHQHYIHYWFLLAAYCYGLATVLNLGAHYSQQLLFPASMVQFIRRHSSSAGVPLDRYGDTSDASFTTVHSQHDASRPLADINYQLLFHAALALKGIVLVVQVTLQTVLIRLASRRCNSPGSNSNYNLNSVKSQGLIDIGANIRLAAKRRGRHRTDHVLSATGAINSASSAMVAQCVQRCIHSARRLCQVYTFLMFANLSLWALEMCEEQARLQVQYPTTRMVMTTKDDSAVGSFEMLTLNGLTRFAGSIVTLSYLFHGLVFMQN